MVPMCQRGQITEPVQRGEVLEGVPGVKGLRSYFREKISEILILSLFLKKILSGWQGGVVVLKSS
jgi:hypothetical protein